MQTGKLRVRLLAILVMFALIAAACGDDDDDGAGGDDGEPTVEATDEGADGGTDAGADADVAGDDEPAATDGGEDASASGDECTEDKVGGELTIGVPAVGSSLDPFSSNSGTLGGELIPIYDSLMRYDAGTGDFVPQLAESLTPNEDSSVWTLVLKPGITFGNGDPMDAAAVKASMDRHLTPGSESVLISFQGLIASVDVVDDLTITLTTVEPWGALPIALTSGLGYVTNVNVVDAVGADVFAQDPTGGGAGPYEVTRWAPPEVIELTAKPDWWGGTVCIQTLSYTVIPLAETAVDAFEGGELDVALIDARDPVASADAKARFPNSSTTVQHGGGIVLLNAGRGESAPATADVRVRQAIAAAIDVDAINERAFNGTSYPQAGLISDASQAFTETAGPAYDPELAASLVEEVKAEGWDGKLRFACVTNLADAALAMEAQLEAVGFDVDLDPSLSLPQEVGIVIEGNYEIACFGHTPDEADLWGGLRGYESTNPRNLSGFADPAMDAALATLRSASTTEEVQAGMEAVQLVWNETVPAAVYSAFEHVLVWNDNVHGLYFNDSPTVMSYFDKAYVDN